MIWSKSQSIGISNQIKGSILELFPDVNSDPRFFFIKWDASFPIAIWFELRVGQKMKIGKAHPFFEGRKIIASLRSVIPQEHPKL